MGIEEGDKAGEAGARMAGAAPKPSMDRGLQADVSPTTVDGPLRHKLFGWRYDTSLTADENYMDLAVLVSRNSQCIGGHMGCVLVRGGGAGAGENAGEILAVATNTPLFQPYASDVHAEVNAVSACARCGQAMAGATAYITMPPCKHCFMVLQGAGVARIVSRHGTQLENCLQAAADLGITWGVVKDSAASEQRRAAYIAEALQGDPGHQAQVVAQRQARKEAKQAAHAVRAARKLAEAERAGERGEPRADAGPQAADGVAGGTGVGGGCGTGESGLDEDVSMRLGGAMTNLGL